MPELRNRPRPLRVAARHWATIVSSAGGVLTALVTGGLLSANQADATQAVLTAADGLVVALAGLAVAVSGAVAAFRTATTAEPEVTPLSDPRDNGGRRLRPGGGPEPMTDQP